MPRLTTRDYKRPSRGVGTARLKDFGLGVVLGIVLASAAFVVSGTHARHRAGVTSRARADGDSPSAPHAPAPDDASSNNPVAGGGSDGSASTAAGSAQAAAQTPQYDFYRMLPRFKVQVPHDEDQAAHATPPVEAGEQARRPATPGRSYLLQVGSYRSGAEADEVRARLARAGISAQVERVVEGSTTWNRVRIGPLTDPELARVREQLRTAKVHALVIRAER